MSVSTSSRLLALALCLLFVVAKAADARAPAQSDGFDEFGFSGREVFKVENQISQVRAGDLDGDGLNDLVVVNNVRSKINLLYNQTGRSNAAAQVGLRSTQKREINELPPGARFRLESIASEKRIAALVLTDLNGDKKPDLAYYGEPRELVVVYNEGTNGWSSPKRWPITDGQLTANALCTGDLSDDARDDLVLLADDSVYTLTQNTDGSLAEPRKIPFSGNVKSVQVVDADGDSLQDLLLVNWEDRHPFRLRLQKTGGDLGPEIYFSHPSIRSYWADSLETNKQTQVMTIAQNSGRAQVSEFQRGPAEPLSRDFLAGQFQVMPLERTQKARRGMLWADMNGDSLPDLLVAEPETGRLAFYEQEPGGLLASPKHFPSLAGVTDIAAADWDGDGRQEIFLLSGDERQVGITRFDEDGRLPFPSLIALEGRPLVLGVGSFQPESKPTLAIIIDQEGKRSIVTRTADGESRSQALSRDFQSNPATLKFHDADQDGVAELVLLIPYEKVKVLRKKPETESDANSENSEDLLEIDIAPPGGTLEQPWLSAADLDDDGKPELLLTQRNFIRAVVMASGDSNSGNGGWVFRVKEQVNGAGAASRLVGATAIPKARGQGVGLFLLDTERKSLTLCERNSDGIWQVKRNHPLPVSSFDQLGALELGATNQNALAFLGRDTVAYLPLHGEVWKLTELDHYETPIRDGHLMDVVSGDLDNNGRKDLVFLETGRNYLDLVVFNAQRRLVPVNRWQVFEERTFRNRRTDLPEPREAVIAELTGDGKKDLAVLVHDRIILYPQE